MMGGGAVLIIVCNFTNKKLKHKNVTEPAQDLKANECGAVIFCYASITVF